jgi:hypothetical protein
MKALNVRLIALVGLFRQAIAVCREYFRLVKHAEKNELQRVRPGCPGSDLATSGDLGVREPLVGVAGEQTIDPDFLNGYFAAFGHVDIIPDSASVSQTPPSLMAGSWRQL